MALEMEQQRAPELTVAPSETCLCMDLSSASLSMLSHMDEPKPFAANDGSKSVLQWADARNPRVPSTRSSGSRLTVETSLAVVRSLGDESGLSKLSSSVSMPSVSMPTTRCHSVSPTVMKDLHFDPRGMADAWSYDAHSFALWTQPTHAIPDPVLSGLDAALGPTPAPVPLLPTHVEQALDHLPLPLSPLHTSSFPSLYMSGSPVALSPHPMLLHQPLNGTSSDATLSSAVTFSDLVSFMDPHFTCLAASSQSPVKHARATVLPRLPPGTSVVNVKELTLNELRPHFNKPMAVVAKELGVCITLMKKICRRNGLVRWPHRRIRSLVNRITSLQVLASNARGAECKRFHAQIAALRDELSTVIQNPNEKSRKSQSEPKMAQCIKPEVFPVAASMETAGGHAGESDATRNKSRPTKRKPTAGLHAHQPPPIKIGRPDERPFTCRIQSHSVPGRRLRGDRRYGRKREAAWRGSVRPSTTTHRNSRRGSISSILNGMPE